MIISMSCIDIHRFWQRRRWQTTDDLACLKDEIRRVIAGRGITPSTVELELQGEECRMYRGACRRSGPEEPSRPP